MVDTLLSNQLTLGPRVKEFEEALRAGSALRMPAWSILVPLPTCLPLQWPATQSAKSTSSQVTRFWFPQCAGARAFSPDAKWPEAHLCRLRSPHDEHGLGQHEKKRSTARPRGLLVHVLGNSCPMQECMDICKEHGLIVVEDTCESLGSLVRIHGASPRYLGTIGDFGTYSFYYSHPDDR